MTSDEPSTLQAGRLQSEYCEGVARTAECLQSFAYEMHPVASRLLGISAALSAEVAEAREPFSVAVFGRMKTGKSTIINALIGRRLAITGVNEATATINRITHAVGADALNRFIVHWKDAAPETFPLDSLQKDWNGTEPDVLARVARTQWIELFSDVPLLRDVHVIDTPGTGSTATTHEVVAQQFINGNSADALVYVFSPVGRETDEEALLNFRKGCLPGSTPYNSVAVMHKWDTVYWDNGGDWADISRKAERLHGQMRGIVAQVVAVSGPLALLAEAADEAFWNEAINIVASYATEPELCRMLAREDKWERSPEQAALYQRAKSEWDIPWISFRVMVRELHRHSCRDALSAQQCILRLSGIMPLRDMLDRRFFRRTAVIRLRRTRTRVQDQLRQLQHVWLQTDAEMQNNARRLVTAAAEVSDPNLRRWLENQSYKLSAEHQALQRMLVEADKLMLNTELHAALSDDAVELIREVEKHSEWFAQPQHVEAVLALLQDNAPLPDDEADAIIYSVCALCLDVDPAVRRAAEKLRDIFMSRMQAI